MHSAPIRVLACSPRASGNSDFMVHNFAQGVRGSGGKVEVTYLRDLNILPCNACHYCSENPEGRCILSARDDADRLFHQLQEASLVFIASPIFFYSVPAQFKAFIDRAQHFWVRRERERADPAWEQPASKPGLLGLVAARARGDKLFEGSILTLQYFLDLFNIRVMESCRLLGYDGPDDLAGDGVACMRLYELGAKAQALVVENAGRRDDV